MFIMKRRNFLKLAATASVAAMAPAAAFAENIYGDQKTKNELSYHTIKELRFRTAQLKYPRLVGRNSRLGHHGTGPSLTFCQLTTDKGATGIGLMQGGRKEAESRFPAIQGKTVADLFAPAAGTLKEADYVFDACLHDLAGVILSKPVYALISGKDIPILTSCYSGMIYFDEMDPAEKPAGLSKILENCLYDYNHGYRQLKVKIGRGGKWMSKDEGLKTDIAVTRLIYDNFPDCDILVDGNDAFTFDYFIEYLKGVEDIPLFWIEEPFRETRDDYAKLKKWCLDHGRRNTLLGDGEANPDRELNFSLGQEGLLDVYLEDVMGYGFTSWRKLMPKLKGMGMMASPHSWGDFVKTCYSAHLAAAYGNTPTIEGVTCFSADLDFSAYKLERGRMHPNTTPGFGIRFLQA